jgi:hypothetical protein
MVSPVLVKPEVASKKQRHQDPCQHHHDHGVAQTHVRRVAAAAVHGLARNDRKRHGDQQRRDGETLAEAQAHRDRDQRHDAWNVQHRAQIPHHGLAMGRQRQRGRVKVHFRVRGAVTRPPE